MTKYLVAHDLGTSGNKATLFTTDGELVRSTVSAYDTKYYNNNWAEQNPDDWWDAVCSSTKSLVQGIDVADVAAVAFSGQMMGCLCVDKDANPLYNAIIWADMRGTKEEAYIKERVGMEEIYKITGHRASASYSLAKFLWIRNNEPDVYKNTYKILHAKDYIVTKMTGKFLTDYSDASGTNMFDLNKFEWSDKIIDGVDVDRAVLPEAVPSTHIAGEISREVAEACGLAVGTPVVVGGGDGGCAAVGAGSVREGITYNCLGSSSWVASTTKEMILDPNMTLFNWAHMVPGYVQPCGTMQTAGSAYAWMKKQMCQLENYKGGKEGANAYDLINNQIAGSEVGANGLLFLPYLLGERSPRWNPDAKGAFIGLKMEHTHADMLRSVVEGVGLNLKVILDLVSERVPVSEIRIMGGLAKSDICSQIFADIYGVKLSALNIIEEATSIGAAVAAGVAVGELDSFNDVDKFVWCEKSYEANKDNYDTYLKMRELFDKSYGALTGVFKELSQV